MISAFSPFPQFLDLYGKPLEGGFLYFGAANGNPETAPVDAFWDAAGTQPIDQPVRTRSGFAVRNGTPANVFVSGDYSMTIRDSRGSMVLYSRTSTEYSNQLENQTTAAALQADIDEMKTYAGPGLIAYAVATAYARGTVGHRLQQVRMLTDDAFGLAESNTALQNDAAIALARTWAAANAPCTLFWPHGTYSYTNAGNWAIAGVTLHFDSTELVCTSATAGHTGLLIHAFEGGGAPSDPIINMPNLSGNLLLTLNASAGYGVRWYGLGRLNNTGTVRVRGGNPTTGRAFSIEGTSIGRAGQLLCSTDIDPTYTMPYIGIYGDTGTRAGVGLGASTNLTFSAIDMAGVSIGVNIVSGDQWRFEGGTAESCLERGVNLSAGARMCIFDGFSMEGNGNEDVVDAGFGNRFNGCYSLSEGGAIFQGRNGLVSGGLWERVERQSDSRGNHIEGVWLGYAHKGSGGYFDSGVGNTWNNLYGQAVTASFATTVMTVTAVTDGVNLQVGQAVYVTNDSGAEVTTTISSLGTGAGGTGTYNLTATLGTLTARGVRVDGDLIPLKARTSIVTGATASPTAWTNTTGGWVELTVQSGTVSAATKARGGVTMTLPTGTPSVYLVAPGEAVSISHGGSLDLSYLPMNGLPG